MNMNFKLGKVVIPMDPEMGMDIVIEGLEVSVSDYNLMEGLKVVQAVPKVLRELRQAMEMDVEDFAPSADVEKEADEKDSDDFISHLIKSAGGHVINTPFGKQVAIPKEHPLASILGGIAKPKNPMDELKDLAMGAASSSKSKEEFKEFMEAQKKKLWEKPELKGPMTGEDLLGKLFGDK